MGFVKKVIKAVSPLAMLTGFGEDKPKTQTPVAVQKQAASDTKTATELAQEEEAKKKAQLIALNAGGSQGGTLGGGEANVTRKNLLGL